MQEFLKDKKKIGIFVIIGIILIATGILYAKSGFKELKKNDTENIFVDDTENSNESVYNHNKESKNSETENNKEINIPIKDKSIVVEIKGEVKKPDVYVLGESSIIKDLIEAAGGLTENADVSNINRAKKLQNHELIYVSNKNEAVSEIRNTNQQANVNNEEKASKKININSASQEELKNLTGIGDAKAKSIIEYREKNGGFKSPEEIKNVTGIGEKMFEKIKEEIEI